MALLSLHSKGNKAVLGQLHETNHSSKSINGNVVGVEYKISDVGKTLCQLVCRFLEAGQDVQKTLCRTSEAWKHVGQSDDSIWRPILLYSSFHSHCCCCCSIIITSSSSNSPTDWSCIKNNCWLAFFHQHQQQQYQHHTTILLVFLHLLQQQ